MNPYEPPSDESQLERIERRFTLHHGDCLDVLKTLADCSVDAIVTDPPYGLSFMGKRWDYDVPTEAVWVECLRVLKPGGHLLAFAGTRTQHRMAVRIEDAGFEIRDMIAWVYGQGFPKSMDISKQLDKGSGENRDRQLKFTAWMRSTGITADQINEATQSSMASHYLTDKSQPAIATAGLFDRLRPFLPDVPEEIERLVCERTGIEWAAYKQREVVGFQKRGNSVNTDFMSGGNDITTASTPAAKQWEGWGTALKPAIETVTVALKPLTEQQEQLIIQSNLFQLEAKLWLLSNAKLVEADLTSSRLDHEGAFRIAQWTAEKLINTQEDLCGRMDMSRFELATSTSLSIALSWRRILGEALSNGSMFTTETKLSTTIDWKTLSFSLSQITPESIIKACSLPGGFSANASIAEKHFNASLLLLQSIHTLSATDNAMLQEQARHQEEGVKPSLDPCIMARKPPIGTVAANVLEHGTGGLNIGACRVGTEGGTVKTGDQKFGWDGSHTGGSVGVKQIDAGRFPANFIHDNSEEVLALLGEAARFYYSPKASRDDRDEGLPMDQHSSHPTVKPTDLMRYLCRLITPPNGIVLDPFTGSGSTGKAAMAEGFRFIGIEREAEYIEIARARISAEAEKPRQLSLF
jgi:DNA modification methylase